MTRSCLTGLALLTVLGAGSLACYSVGPYGIGLQEDIDEFLTAEATASDDEAPTDSPLAATAASRPTAFAQPTVECATAEECSNAGTHEYSVSVEESVACTYSGDPSVRYTITFVPGGANMQFEETAPVFYERLADRQYQFILSNGDINALAFDVQGFSIVQTKPDGSACLVYVYTRSE